MAVTAARGSEGTRLAWNSSGGKPSAGFGRQRICLSHLDHLFDRYDKLVAANHIQVLTRSEFDGTWIISQPLNFQLQRLVYVAKRLNVGLH